MRDRSNYENLKKGSDELGCSNEIIFHNDGLIEIDEFVFKGEGKRYRKEDITRFMLNWHKFFGEESISLDKALEKMEPDEPVVDYDYEEDPCNFDGKCLAAKMNSQAVHKECGDIKLLGERVRVCKYYKQPWVTVYAETREYGGPEEGGWYYTEGRPVIDVPVFSEKDKEYVQEMLEGMDYRCHGDIKVSFSCCKGEPYPSHPPHYS